MNRKVPEIVLSTGRDPAGSVLERLDKLESRAADASDFGPVGSDLAARDEWVARPLQPATVAPNAPLLARLVRHPFELAVAPFRRVADGLSGDQETTGDIRAMLSRQPVVDPNGRHIPTGSALRRFREEFGAGPEFRPHPFSRQRAEGGVS